MDESSWVSLATSIVVSLTAVILGWFKLLRPLKNGEQHNSERCEMIEGTLDAYKDRLEIVEKELAETKARLEDTERRERDCEHDRERLQKRILDLVSKPNWTQQ